MHAGFHELQVALHSLDPAVAQVEQERLRALVQGSE